MVPVAVGGCFGALSTRLSVGDSDSFWQLVTGHDMLARGLAWNDVYSWTVAGKPISVDQWLGQALWATAFDAGGWRGVVALRALAIAILVGLVLYAALRERPGRPLVAVLAALPALALSRFIWVERPELFGFACFAALIALLYAARAGSDRALWWIPPLIVVWANLHGSFAIGAVLAVLFAIEGAIAQPMRRQRYAIVAIASVVATFVTPAGLGTWTAPGFHFLHPPREIQEWSVPDPTTVPGAIFALTMCAALAIAFIAGGGARAAVVLAPVLFVSLIATRQMPLFAIAAAPFFAAYGPTALKRSAELSGLRLPAFATGQRPPGRRADAVAVALTALLLGGAAVTGTEAPSLADYPTAALSSLRAGPGLLNQYDWGGYLIWAAPATPVFVDGRLTPYLPDVLTDYTTVIGVHPGWREVLARRGIRQLLVRPADPVAIRAHDLGWPIRASSDTFVLIDVP